MKIGLIVVGLLALAVIAVLFLRGRGQRREGGNVASYEEVKRRIPAGEVSPNQIFEPPEPEPPMPLERIYELDDSNKFVMALFDNIAHKTVKDDGYKLNSSESAIVHIYGLEAEVNNGGFDQYFFNSEGDNAAKALAGLELIGAKKMTDIVRRAVSLFGDGGPARDRETRWKQMDKWSEADKATLEALDNEFFKYPDPIADLAMRYCLAHRKDFSE